MANIAGYRAVIEAAHTFGRFFTGQVTAAGKVQPAKVLVAGAGVAGLAAIGAASSMGAIVRATDVRPEVAEQVRSLGGDYVAVPAGEAEVSSDGYAREMGEDFNRRAAEMYAEQVPDVDIVITTALIPGRPAPRLITRGDGGEHEVGQRDRGHGRRAGRQRRGLGRRRTGRHRQRRLDHRLHRPGRPAARAGLAAVRAEPGQPAQAAHPGQGRRSWFWTSTTSCSARSPSSATARRPGRRRRSRCRPRHRAPVATAPAAELVKPKPAISPGRRFTVVGIAAALLFLITAFSPTELIQHLTVFALAVVVGFYVIGHVHHALHTPLMSVTNAISGIIVVGALLQIGHDSVAVTVLAFVAILLASINVFGGFAVTRRMLGMFTRGPAPKALATKGAGR